MNRFMRSLVWHCQSESHFNESKPRKPESFKVKHAFDVIQTSVPKGIKCFGFSSSNSAIITGGGDRTLRIWLRKVLKEGQIIKYLLVINYYTSHGYYR